MAIVCPQGILVYSNPWELRPHDVIYTNSSGDLWRGLFWRLQRISLGDRAGHYTLTLDHWRVRQTVVQVHSPVLVLVGAEGVKHSWPRDPSRPLLVGVPTRRP